MKDYKTVHQNKNELEQFYTKSEKLNIKYLSDVFSLVEKLAKDYPNDAELGAVIRRLFSA